MMNTTITLESIDSLYCSLQCDDYITRQEISSHFTYQFANFQFTPAHKNRGWDGSISVYNPGSDIFYNGSVSELKSLADVNGWIIDDNREDRTLSLSDEDIEEFYSSLNFRKYKVREHQDKAFRSIISNDGNGFYISPTSSGKSFIAFLAARYTKEMFGGKTLLVVPTVHLVGQMTKDFISYTTDDLNIKQISAGVNKDYIPEDYVITTWHSIKDMPKDWFDQFDCFIGDEGHGFTADSLKTIIGKCGNIQLRFAMTGSLRGCPVARMQLEAYFGRIFVVTTYQELLERGYISPAEVKIMLFKHSKNNIKDLQMLHATKMDEHGKIKGSVKYHNELTWLSECRARNEFIINMVKNLKGNIIIMVKDLDHGEILKPMLEAVVNKPITFINGKVKAGLRLEAMDEMEDTGSGMIILATFKSFGTGTSINNVHHLIMADMIKSDETLIQTLGRILRTHESKDMSYLWDLADDMKPRSNSKNNFSLNHLAFRCEVYDDIGFDYKVYERELT